MNKERYERNLLRLCEAINTGEYNNEAEMLFVLQQCQSSILESLVEKLDVDQENQEAKTGTSKATDEAGGSGSGTGDGTVNPK